MQVSREGKSSAQIPQKVKDELLCWLARHPLDQIPRDTTGDLYVWKVGNVMVVRHDESITAVFKKLTTENFLSAPVMKMGRFIGFVDMLDLVKFTADLFSGETEAQWADLFDKRSDFREATVEDIMQTPSWGGRRSALDPFQPVLPDFSLLHVWETLARSGAHRVAILNRQNELEGLMTHSMCISMIRQNLDKFGSISQLTLKEMHPDLPQTVISICESETALKAFNKMAEKNLSGLAVVDSEGVLKGALSIRDLRGVGTSGADFSRLFLSVKDYKDVIVQHYPQVAPRTHFSAQTTPRGAVYLTPDRTFQDLIRAMDDGNIHRVFVCTEESVAKGKPKPAHVISQRDVLLLALIQTGMPYPDEL